MIFTNNDLCTSSWIISTRYWMNVLAFATSFAEAALREISACSWGILSFWTTLGIAASGVVDDLMVLLVYILFWVGGLSAVGAATSATWLIC